MATVSVIGAGGGKIASPTTPIGQSAGAPPELHLNQWGVYRIDVNPNPQDRA